MKVGLDITMIVGDNIRRIRIAQEISQGQLAYETGLSREFITKVESGRNNISIRKLALIAQALNVEPQELVTHKSGDSRKQKGV